MQKKHQQKKLNDYQGVSSDALVFYSPAKINLSLKITGRRPDGYHEIETLMQTIDLCDQISFKLSDEDKLFCSDDTLPIDRRNLVWKAVDLFREKTGWNHPLEIRLDKHIPHQAGLGGGSSNAATTLWALNELSGLAISVDNLMMWSGEIGSDIPFFFSSGCAFCTGRGERVEDREFSEKQLIIVKPQVSLSTQSVYTDLCPEDWGSQPVNDLEAPAFRLAPELAVLQHQLFASGFDQVSLSGSGSAFFCFGSGVAPSGTLAKTIIRTTSWYSL